MDLKDIKAIIDLMKKNSISEFELEKQDFKIRLKRGHNGNPQITGVDEPQPPTFLQLPSNPAVTPLIPVSTSSVPSVAELDIKSPMVGTFYRAPSPESSARFAPIWPT